MLLRRNSVPHPESGNLESRIREVSAGAHVVQFKLYIEYMNNFLHSDFNTDGSHFSK